MNNLPLEWTKCVTTFTNSLSTYKFIFGMF